MNKRMRSNLLLLLVAFIWGSAFVAQSSAMDYVGPYTYNMTRNVLAFAFLVPVIWFMEGKGKSKSVSATLRPNKQTVIGGICCGIALAVASTFQQVGITMTTAGKAGFITALYIIHGANSGRFYW